MASRNFGLRKLIAPMLESIDAIQSERSEPLHRRPFDAASIIVRHSIITIEGDDDKENFVGKPWFAAIYAEIHRWYESKYGPPRAQSDNPLGLIVHAGLPHTIDIPKTISVLQDTGLLKLTFPSKLYPGERSATWVHPKIRVKSLSLAAREKLTKRIASTCNAIRLIGINTVSAGGENSKVPLMAGSIVEHLSKAASTASSSHKLNNSLALWDIHLACEKSIKSLLTQREISFPNTHDLKRLNVLLGDPQLERKASLIISRLPNHKNVIKHRYLESTPISSNALFFYYYLALKLCTHYTSFITHEYRIADSSFFLKKPPWFSQLEV